MLYMRQQCIKSCYLYIFDTIQNPYQNIPITIHKLYLQWALSVIDETFFFRVLFVLEAFEKRLTIGSFNNRKEFLQGKIKFSPLETKLFAKYEKN